MKNDIVIIIGWFCIAGVMYFISDTPLDHCAAYAAVTIAATQAIVRQTFGPLCGPLLIGIPILLHMILNVLDGPRAESDPLIQLVTFLLSPTGVLLESGLSIFFSTVTSISKVKQTESLQSVGPCRAGGAHRWAAAGSDPDDSARVIFKCERCPRTASMGNGFSPGPDED